MLLAYETRIYELPYERENPNYEGESDSIFNTVYMICITVFTVGYGDISASVRRFCQFPFSRPVRSLRTGEYSLAPP